MHPAPRDLDSAVAETVHDVLGGLGTIRLGVTAAREEDDGAFRRTLLDGAEQEVRRIAGLVSALGPLVTSRTTKTDDIEAGELAARVVERAGRRRVRLDVDAAEGTVAAPAGAAELIAALGGIVAAGGAVRLSVQPQAQDVLITLSPVEPGHYRDERLTGHLIAALGGVPQPATGAVAFTLAARS